VRPTYALRYDVGDEQQVKIRCGQLIATLYGQFFLGFGPRAWTSSLDLLKVLDALVTWTKLRALTGGAS
jgi:hypothetical protein